MEEQDLLTVSASDRTVLLSKDVGYLLINSSFKPRTSIFQ